MYDMFDDHDDRFDDDDDSLYLDEVPADDDVDDSDLDDPREGSDQGHLSLLDRFYDPVMEDDSWDDLAMQYFERAQEEHAARYDHLIEAEDTRHQQKQMRRLAARMDTEERDWMPRPSERHHGHKPHKAMTRILRRSGPRKTTPHDKFMESRSLRLAAREERERALIDRFHRSRDRFAFDDERTYGTFGYGTQALIAFYGDSVYDPDDDTDDDELVINEEFVGIPIAWWSEHRLLQEGHRWSLQEQVLFDIGWNDEILYTTRNLGVRTGSIPSWQEYYRDTLTRLADAEERAGHYDPEYPFDFDDQDWEAHFSEGIIHDPPRDLRTLAEERYEDDFIESVLRQRFAARAVAHQAANVERQRQLHDEFEASHEPANGEPQFRDEIVREALAHEHDPSLWKRNATLR